jgi:hypothetical protein
MAYNFSAILAELEGIVKSVWPETILFGDDAENRTCFTSFEMLRKNIIEASKDGNPAPPYVVIQLGSAVPDPDLGIAENYKRLPLTIYFITETITQAAITEKLADLQETIDAADAAWETFGVMEKGRILTVEDCQANRALVAIGKTQLSAGEVTWSPGIITTDG